jgi:hypothetical protein
MALIVHDHAGRPALWIFGSKMAHAKIIPRIDIAKKILEGLRISELGLENPRRPGIESHHIFAGLPNSLCEDQESRNRKRKKKDGCDLGQPSRLPDAPNSDTCKSDSAEGIRNNKSTRIGATTVFDQMKSIYSM